MCDEHDINIDVETNKKDKQKINQIEGYTVKIRFSNNGLHLEHLIDAYIKEKLFVTQ